MIGACGPYNLGGSTTPDVETPYSKFDGDLQAIDEGFVLDCVVGGGEVEPNHVAHVYSEGRDEEQTRACPGLHQGPVEVHGPAFRLDLSRGQLGVGPLSHKISQGLGFNCFPRHKRQGFPHEFHGPLGYSTRGLPVLDYLSQRER